MSDAERKPHRRLGLYSLSFLRQSGLRNILTLLGYAPVAGPISRSFDAIAVWGQSPAAMRGTRAATRRNVPLISLEDPFLRSVLPGEQTPIGLLLDHQAPYYDATRASDLEDILQGEATNDAALKSRAKDGLKFLKSLKLSKYNAWKNEGVPTPGFVLVIDQSKGDAAIELGGATAESFAQMLRTAKSNHPNTPIFIRRHPRDSTGHFKEQDLDTQTQFLPADLNPWDVLKAAAHVYAVTSQMGMEAIFAGHKPHLFGAPFYAGWGLSVDRIETPRRTAKRSAEQLFAAAYLLYPTWYDPDRGQLSDFETAARQLARRRDHWQRNTQGAVFLGVRKWKQNRVASFLGPQTQPAIFAADAQDAVTQATSENRRIIVWASKEPEELDQLAQEADIPLLRVEDGFLRSAGLGANLFPALSLVFDDLGIYYDPSRPSRLEKLIEGAASLSAQKRQRVLALMRALRSQGLTKYNQGNPMPTVPARQDRTVILVPGQVEDDASILLGAGKIRTNIDLVRTVRAENPDAFLIYKPHPDVEAGLRLGALPDLPEGLVDIIARDANPADALAHADEVWTMTSLMGFEALIRGKKVTTFGTPFYAGWGLTTDLGPANYRRRARPSLEGLVHAALIEYPDYINPKTGSISSVEATLDLLAQTPQRAPSLLGRLQRMARKHAWLWRR